MPVVRAVLILLIAAGVCLGQDPAVTRAASAMAIISGVDNNGNTVAGSGFVVSANGTIVTNLHLVKGLAQAKVELADGDVFDSFTVVGSDARRDLAIIRIAGFELPYVLLGNSNAIQTGDAVTLVRGPKADTPATTVRGVVASDGFRLIQTGADARASASGGLLLSAEGKAIGVLGYQGSSATAVAIPINYARGLMDTAPEVPVAPVAGVNAIAPMNRPPRPAKPPRPQSPSTPINAEATPAASVPVPAIPSTNVPASAPVAESVPVAATVPAPEPKHEIPVVNAAAKAPVPVANPARPNVARLPAIRKIFIEPIGTGEGPEMLRDDLVRYLQESNFQVVDSREKADAVLSGTGKWARIRIERFRARLVTTTDQEIWSGELSTGGWIRSASGIIARALVKNVVRALAEQSAPQ